MSWLRSRFFADGKAKGYLETCLDFETEVAGKPHSIDAWSPDLVDVIEVIAKLGGEPHGERAVDLGQDPGSWPEIGRSFNVAGQTPAADCALHNVPSALTSIEPVQERV